MYSRAKEIMFREFSRTVASECLQAMKKENRHCYSMITGSLLVFRQRLTLGLKQRKRGVVNNACSQLVSQQLGALSEAQANTTALHTPRVNKQ